ncbi:MAG: hypothetical protein ACYS8W_19410 [Planctomycetota bacterium]|jgi:hypothetical protein
MDKTPNISDFTWRPPEEKDDEELIEMWKEAFRKPITPEFWKWKYHQVPSGTQSAICITPDNNFAAHSGLQIAPSHWAGKDALIGTVTDSMVRRKYRTRGLGFRNLYLDTLDACVSLHADKEQPIFWISFGGKRSARLVFLTGKYFDTGPIPVLLKSLSGPTLEYGLKDRFRFNIHETENFGPEIDEFWNSQRTLFPMVIDRSADYLNWRYAAKPGNTYRRYVIKYRLSGRIAGFAVSDHDKSKGRILELYISSNEKGALNKILALIEYHLRFDGAGEAEIWYPAWAPLADELKAAGYQPSEHKEGMVLGARIFHPDLEQDWLSKNFFYTMGETDTY